MKAAWILPLALLPALAVGQKVTTPARESADRKGIMNALRPKVESALGIKVIFEVTHLKMKGDWSMMTATPRHTNGKAIDYSKTKLKPEMEAFEDWVCALFRKDAKTKKWVLITHVLGATDVAWYGWWEEYKAPRDIFPKSN